jgi:hypothetical protein
MLGAYSKLSFLVDKWVVETFFIRCTFLTPFPISSREINLSSQILSSHDTWTFCKRRVLFRLSGQSTGCCGQTGGDTGVKPVLRGQPQVLAQRSSHVAVGQEAALAQEGDDAVDELRNVGLEVVKV